MPNAKLKNYLHLHFLVFIAGFTAILGKLISISSVPLVWFRMLIAGVLMLIYIRFRKLDIKIPLKTMLRFFLAGIFIALHWITFFESIKQANVSITLAMLSTSAFFASFLEPLFYKRRIIWYEVLFGTIVIIGVFLITKSEIIYINGIVLGAISALFSTLFSILNGQFIKIHRASVISIYEFMAGFVFITFYIVLFRGGFDILFIEFLPLDWLWILILASVCTAYAFIGVVQIMKYLSPYTVILTYNLEPVYGIIMAVLLFTDSEVMSTQFYWGASLMLATILLNGILKNTRKSRNTSGNLSLRN